MRPSRLACLALMATGISGGPACSCGEADPLENVEVIARPSDDPLDFGLVPIGAEAAKSVFLYNDGNARMEIDQAIVLDGSDGVFAVIDPGTFPVAAGSFTAISVRFIPPAEGTFSTTMTIPVAAPGVPVSLTVRGEGEPANVSLSPAELLFGELEAGSTATQSVMVTNLAEVEVSIGLAVEGGGFLIDGAARIDLALEPSEQRSVEVRFSPDRGGAFEAALRAETCGIGCGPFTALRGTGLAPRIDVQPRPIAFGEVPVGGTHTVEVRISNDGIGNLEVATVSLTDPSGSVQLGNPPALPAVLSGDDELAFFLTYVPALPEGAFSATLVVESSDPLQGRVSIPLTASTPGAALKLLPEAANFGLIEPGAQRVVDIVAVSVGTVPISVDAISIAGSDFTFDGPAPILPIVLDPAESVLLPVVATATPEAVANGGAAGAFLVTADGITHTSNLAFTSGVEGCQPRTVVGNLDLGFLRVGDGSNGVLVVENVGTAACTGGALGPALSLPFDPGFDWQELDAEVLEPGELGQIAVAYTASSEGQHRAFFELHYAEREAPLLLSATATGRLGTLTPQPAGVAFGPGIEGCPGNRRTVSFVNDGATGITLNDVEFTLETAEVTMSHAALPYVVQPGATFEVRLRSQNVAVGFHTTQVSVETEEVGDVQAWVTSEVFPEDTPLAETFFVAEGEGAVDILFIVDNSGSMFDDQQRLASNFAAFIDAAFEPGAANDFHLGVTSTDVLSDGALAGQLVANPTVLTPGTSNLENVFAEHAALGIEGTGLELGLEAMRLALDRPLSTGHNAGFHRENAALSVIVVSDEDDGGDQPFTPPEHQRSIDSYIEFLSAVKGGVLTETPILFSAVVYPTASPRYSEMVDAFGGVTLDISQDTWGEQLGQIGSATFGISARFRLANPASAGSLIVTVDGTPTTDFSLDATGETVLLNTPPDPGAIVEITYVPDC